METLKENATCYHYELGCGHNDGREMVNDVLEVVTRSDHFENLPGRGVSASWISLDHEGAANVNQTDDGVEGAGKEFSRAIVPGPDPYVWDCDSCSCSYPGFCFGCVACVSEVDLHFVFDSSRGRNFAYDRHP